MSNRNPERRSLLPKPCQVQRKQGQTGTNNSMDKAKEQKLPTYKIYKTKSTTSIISEHEIIHVQNKYIDILGININDFYNPTFAQNDQREKKPTDKKLKKPATVLPKRVPIQKKKSHIFRGETYTNISDRKLKNLFDKDTVEKINWRERKASKGNGKKLRQKQLIKKDPPKFYSITYSPVQLPALQTAELEPAHCKESLFLFNVNDLVFPPPELISEAANMQLMKIIQKARRELRACAACRNEGRALALTTDSGSQMFTRILINTPITFIFLCGFLTFVVIYCLHRRI